MGNNNPQNIPPQNIEAEQSVIGSILLENEAISKALEILKPDDFYYGSHQQVFQCMIELFEKNEPTDFITITERLKKKKKLEEIGGASYIADLSEKIPTAANIEFYAKIVKEKSVLRKLIHSATEIVSKAATAQENVEDLLDFSENTIFSISEYHIKPSFFPLKDILKATFKDIEKLYEKKQLITGIPTGFTDLDERTSGFQPSDLIIIAGRPSMGKTAFSLNVAQYAAHEANVPIAVFSLEMSKEQLALRMLCSEARVDNHKLRSGFIAESEWGKLSMGAGKLSDAKIFIDDTPGITVLEMRAKTRRLKAEHGLGMVIVDYLQLMGGSRNRTESREQEISEISRSLKALAKELRVPVVALSQLNRRVEDRVNKRPLMADLRESGAIEQDADLILFIYRDEVYHPDSEEVKGRAEIIIGKQRNGPVGEINLIFINEYTRFENYSYREIK
jgi:replicative DNA helicase